MIALDWRIVEVPRWYDVVLPATIIYTLLALLLAKWAFEPRVLVALPVMGTTAAGAYAALMLVRVLLLVESAGVRTRAAGVSEALFLVTCGAAAAALLSGTVAAMRSYSHLWKLRTRAGSVWLMLAAANVLLWAAFMWYLTRSEVTYTEQLERVARSLFLLSTATTVSGVVVAFWRRIGRAAKEGRRWYIFLAAVSVVLAVSLALAGYSLRRFIASS